MIFLIFAQLCLLRSWKSPNLLYFNANNSRIMPLHVLRKKGQLCRKKRIASTKDRSPKQPNCNVRSSKALARGLARRWLALALLCCTLLFRSIDAWWERAGLCFFSLYYNQDNRDALVAQGETPGLAPECAEHVIIARGACVYGLVAFVTGLRITAVLLSLSNQHTWVTSRTYSITVEKPGGGSTCPSGSLPHTWTSPTLLSVDCGSHEPAYATAVTCIIQLSISYGHVQKAYNIPGISQLTMLIT